MNATRPPSSVLDALLRKGVRVPLPESVWVGDEVNPDRIAPSVELCPGTRLHGSRLSIGPGCRLGTENPVTVADSQLAAHVTLKGGFVSGSVFLEGSSVGNAGHIRAGCLFEEEASTAHAVGCKQTILMSFVTLGSLINFCDCLMTGGTSRQNHSEVGSSFIHFNFTPHADKATPSRFGDVPRGVLLDQPPVFLGGQGGVVGPVQTEFGVVQAAGSICRRDLDAPDHLYQSSVARERWGPYRTGQIRDAGEKLRKNLDYIGTLSALRLWYREFRGEVMPGDVFTRAALEASASLLEDAQRERLKQLEKWLNLLPAFQEESPRLRKGLARLRALMERGPEPGGLQSMAGRIGVVEPYADAVAALTGSERQTIVKTLQSEIQRFTSLVDDLSPETES